ncbi:hypothetical protein DFH07DRAFT_959319 [Mycena maculata]|uniref:Uncharacterized protein n=1 Tax=Mycena maculata TaxID=230809 RepID=A0AAD7NDH8_9AGAR|nr:hypothetical protein DFH07DRAFT_959319 [Mycena maculata]
MPLSPLRPHPQPQFENASLHTLSPAKHTLHCSTQPGSPPRAPSTPCRTPTTPLTDHTTLLAGLHSQTASVSVTACTTPAPRDRILDASINDATSTRAANRPGDIDDAFGQKIHTSAGGRERAHAPVEGPHDVPSIAFLREPKQSSSVSPVSARTSSPCAADVVPLANAPGRDPLCISVSTPLNNEYPASTTQPSSAFVFAHTSSLTGPSSPFPSSAPSPTTLPGLFLAPRGTQPAPAPRTRAETGASAHDLPPLYTYTYDSLIRRPAGAFNNSRNEHAKHADAGQRDLGSAYDTTEAPLGKLQGPPALGIAGLAAHVETLRAGEDAMQVDENEGLGSEKMQREWWVAPRPNTAPSAAYALLLEETFGAGSALRGEGAKPADGGRKRRGGKALMRGQSPSTGRSAGSSGFGEDIDVGSDESVSVDIGTRAQRWIAEIEVLVKGKRLIEREDLKALSGTLREISEMDADDGRALGDDAPRLRKSLWGLAQLEDIPFRDEYQVRGWARRLLKHWPRSV